MEGRRDDYRRGVTAHSMLSAILAISFENLLELWNPFAVRAH